MEKDDRGRQNLQEAIIGRQILTCPWLQANRTRGGTRKRREKREAVAIAKEPEELPKQPRGETLQPLEQ